MTPSKPLPATGKAKLRRIRFLEADLTLPRAWLARLFAASKGCPHDLEHRLRTGVLGRVPVTEGRRR
ncbi:MAG TPA: hypothetical protein PKX00_13045 [Opitutaceae bacterium]|nr:hypothetical protein [Opitutaceae bacterium]